MKNVQILGKIKIRDFLGHFLVLSSAINEFSFYTNLNVIDKREDNTLENVFDRLMVYAFVKKAIHNLKYDPERTVRNLIDMALLFTDSRFQHEFYSSAQNLLSNEKSCYYTLLKETITQVNEETLLTFSMNLGCNGLYEGSMKIRDTEQKEHYNIPWTAPL